MGSLAGVKSRSSRADTGQPTLIWRLPSYLFPTEPGSLFPEAGHRGVELEIGCGDGGFMLQWAGLHPDRRFIGLERLLGRLRKLDRKGRRQGLGNLRLLRVEAGYYLRYLAPAGVFEAVHVYFPDPWPKRKHLRHRLVNDAFARNIVRVLTPGGKLYLRTDNEDYHRQMLEVLGAQSGLSPIGTPPDLAGIRTEFERQFNEQGIATRRLAYVKDG